MPNPTKYSTYKFSLKEYFVLEILTARYRLGENSWTFPLETEPTLVKLEKKGLVRWKYGVIEDSCLVWLTDLGKAVTLSTPYTSFNNKVVEAAAKPMKQIQRNAARLKKTLTAKYKAEKKAAKAKAKAEAQNKGRPKPENARKVVDNENYQKNALKAPDADERNRVREALEKK